MNTNFSPAALTTAAENLNIIFRILAAKYSVFIL
jgi:hypothetical protein